MCFAGGDATLASAGARGGSQFPLTPCQEYSRPAQNHVERAPWGHAWPGVSHHANADLDVWGNTVIEHNATAAGVYDESGSADVGGTAAGDQPIIDVAPVIPINSKALATYIFTDGGQVVRQSDGAIVCTAVPSNNCKDEYGWEWEGSGDGWSTNEPIDGDTVYVEGPVNWSGNSGTVADPVNITIIAEGSIHIIDSPDITPASPSLMFVTGGDLKISGSPSMTSGAEGRILVHEQVEIAGWTHIYGQILVENEGEGVDDDIEYDSLVTQNLIEGNPDIDYSGTFVSNVFTVTGWRDVRN